MSTDTGNTTREGLVSVIIPTYDDDEYLPRAVKSAIKQRYAPIEILIIDSSDSAVANELMDTHDQVTRLSAPPEGPGAARNVGIEAAKGEYIAFLDADDEWLENKLVRQISRLVSTESAFVFSEEYLVTPNGEKKLLDGIDFPDNVPAHQYYFQKGTGIGSRTVVTRAECLTDFRFDEELDAREDPHLWTRIISKYDPIKIEEPLAIKYSRSDSLTSDIQMLWKNERKSITKLANEFEELRPYREERLFKADYRYAKRLLETGEYTEARKILSRLRRDRGADLKIASLLAISYLPFGHSKSVKYMDSVYKKIS